MTTLRLRSRLLPRTFADFSAFIFLWIAIPSVYWFEVFIVLPTVCNQVLYILHVIAGTFIVVNILGNFVAMTVVETSTKGLMMPSTQVPVGWHVCAQCESVAPPRSRHCNTCNTCILKREHHCVFTGCCIGLNNHRFFFIFLVYMWGSTLYCSFLNNFFIWPYVGGFGWWALVRLILPGIWLVYDPSIATLYAFLYAINVIGCLFMSVLLYYYTTLLLQNATTSENNNRQAGRYDMGWQHNIKVALGERWKTVWLFPLWPSPLPYNGMEWSKKQANPSVRRKEK